MGGGLPVSPIRAMRWTASAETRIIYRMVVRELVPATDVVDHSDVYLEVNLRFRPEHHLRYCYFEDHGGGPDKGYIEVGFTEDTGDIAELVVITRPAAAGSFPDVPILDGSIRVSLAHWEDPRITYVRERGILTVSTKEHAVYYAVSDTPPAKFVRSGPAGFGVSEAGELTGFVTGLA